jgi:hypothetical protein
MMDREKIIGLFTSGKYMGGTENKSALHDIIHTYPYFQLAQVLYARQVYDDNDTDVTNQVKIASAYAPNRKAMYMLFKKQSEDKTIARQEVKPITAPVKEDVKYNFVFHSTTLQTKDETVKADSYVSDVVMLPEAENKPKGSTEKASPLSETFLEKEILGAAASAITEKDISKAIEVADNELKESAPTEHIHVIPEEVKKGISAGEIHSFDEWLKRMPTVDTSVQAVSGQSEEKQATPKKAADIIQQFLENQPRISKPKAEFFSPTKAARHSIMEDDDLVSETLAKILVQQSNLHKALRAYEVLILQNPQKKAYFAARIKEIRKVIESGNSKK